MRRGGQFREVLSAVLNESGYEMMLRTEGSQDRLDNLAELKQAVYEYENHLRRGMYPGALPGPCGPLYQ